MLYWIKLLLERHASSCTLKYPLDMEGYVYEMMCLVPQTPNRDSNLRDLAIVLVKILRPLATYMMLYKDQCVFAANSMIRDAGKWFEYVHFNLNKEMKDDTITLQEVYALGCNSGLL